MTINKFYAHYGRHVREAFIFIISCILISSFLYEVSGASCSAGQYLHSNGTCQACPSNSYMKEKNHTADFCRQCPFKSSELVTIICNTTYLSIECIPGYFHSNGDTPMCQKCTKCSPWQRFVVECGSNHDAICCNKSKVYNETSGQCENQWNASPFIRNDSLFSTILTLNWSTTAMETISTESVRFKKSTRDNTKGIGQEGIILLCLILPFSVIIWSLADCLWCLRIYHLLTKD
ncbi:tumor necrosis factor receptor superfamily member 10C [Biomphalaria pfeifferi]|uniref:Tumor necrosis factor receptor superfamily member 10C n=1 Tax=Biomphalaria pfeifferi TaxID=112525 RepID=A0AAD8B8S0_BIOPF|nr:tumor necrosis factor receptor superfamily member 10C [Biomphalaria pfeifferi]